MFLLIDNLDECFIALDNERVTECGLLTANDSIEMPLKQ
jgi:hypothetical protein